MSIHRWTLAEIEADHEGYKRVSRLYDAIANSPVGSRLGRDQDDPGRVVRQPTIYQSLLAIRRELKGLSEEMHTPEVLQPSIMSEFGIKLWQILKRRKIVRWVRGKQYDRLAFDIEAYDEWVIVTMLQLEDIL